MSDPTIILLRASNLTVNDLPAPDLANTTILAFSRLNLSKITRPLLCILIPYRTPLLSVRSAEVNGKLVEIAPVFILRRICSSSVNCGTVLLSPCSCWLEATFEKTNCCPNIVSILCCTKFSSSILSA